MMEVVRSSWHFRVYRTWRLYWHGCEPRGTVNLCPYMRAVLLWAPLTILILPFRVPIARAVTLGVLIAAPLHIPYGEAAIVVATIYLIIAATALVALVIGPFLEFGIVMPVEAAAGTSFWKLLRARGVAVHDRVCPELRVL
ncbi:hypothetical protein LCGC14_2332120 [marine sediment metagenome]|uniref:Uncharacterized protein n=1 Tax=marine sediment metagenome TaxID=412755 RepID=A0A0F9D223_9ZZZZ